MASASTPHFDLPFTFGASARVVEQDSIDDIANCVLMLLRTEVGSRPEAPGFGVDDLTFRLRPLDLEALRDMIVQLEPRAAAILSSRPDEFDELLERITVEVQTARGVTI